MSLRFVHRRCRISCAQWPACTPLVILLKHWATHYSGVAIAALVSGLPIDLVLTPAARTAETSTLYLASSYYRPHATKSVAIFDAA